MTITKETKERFVKMLKARQIIVIQCNKGSNRKTYDFKFIGANNSGKWDFTPLVAAFSCYQSNNGCQDLVIRSLDGVSVICSTLCELKREGFESDFGDGYSQYEKNPRPADNILHLKSLGYQFSPRILLSNN